jgi:hypothetical protein
MEGDAPVDAAIWRAGADVTAPDQLAGGGLQRPEGSGLLAGEQQLAAILQR